jgi:glycosyltransferase involved in cell wall biosynthesis
LATACATQPIPINNHSNFDCSMKIAFYAPLKSPDHPVPSGDRQMARLLMAALARAGHDVGLASSLRTYLSDPSAAVFAPVLAQSEREIARIEKEWDAHRPPDLWFAYHPYYKAPDLIGPSLAKRFAIPYVTCEASYAPKRDSGEWRDRQALVKRGIEQSALNIYFTPRDRAGLAQIVPEAALAELKPFTDMIGQGPERLGNSPGDLIAVAMMRKGDKFDSFRMLAKSLALMLDVSWHLTVIGHGPLAGEVKGLFASMPKERLTWTGELSLAEIQAHLCNASIYVWPGCGEAYGMAYLEAQAAGLPVIAQDTAGVPSVVRNGETGILVAPGDAAGFAAAIRDWILDPAERLAFGERARQFVRRERSLDQAAARIGALLEAVLHQRQPVAG